MVQAPSKVVGFYYGTTTTSMPVFADRIQSELKRINGDCVVLKINDELISNESVLFLEVSVQLMLLISAARFLTSPIGFSFCHYSLRVSVK